MRPSRLACPLRGTTALLLCVTLSMAALATAARATRPPAQASAAPAFPQAQESVAGSLPGVGHDATYRQAPCPKPNVPGFPQFNLGPNFKCGYLTVPENRYQPHGRKIRIAVAIAEAATRHPHPDPLLWLEGGPGGTGLAVAVAVVKLGINADRRIIFIDQRGTLHADPLLSCPEIDRFLRRSVGLAPTNPATGAQDVAAVRACRDRLAAQGYDLAAYNTAENAADAADLRVALHVKQWNVYGVSYGTDLALQLLRDYPTGIRSMVLDSIVPPQLSLIQEFWPAAQRGYQAVFDACAAQPACHTAYPNLRGEFTAAVNRLTRKPLTVAVRNPATAQRTKVVFDGYQLANLLVVLSLYPGSLADAPAMVHKLAAGDGMPAAIKLLGTVPRFVGLTGYGLTFGVFCSEGVPFTTPRKVEAVARQALPTFPARVLALVPQEPRLFSECTVWHVHRASPSVSQPVHSAVPVLLLTGTFDAITPPAWADLAAQGLTHSTVLRFPGVGHDVIAWRHKCGATVMVKFLDRPNGGYDTSCVDKLSVPAFKTGP
jgi:pimeloyl-ACP methyl ester carboxylesterase